MEEKISPRWKSRRALSFAASVVLPLSMYILTVPTPVFRYIVPVFVLLVGGLQVLFWRRAGSGLEGRMWIVVRSVLFYVAWFGLLFLMPSGSLQVGYLLLSVPILFMAQQLVHFGGETILITHTSITACALLLIAAAAEYYFRAGSVLLTAVVFMLLFLLARATFAFVPQTPQVRLAASLLVALLATQGFAAVLFLPFHYSVLGFLAFLGFYVAWLLTYYWQFNVLTKQKIKFYGLFALALAAAVLLVTPWEIVA